MNDLKIGQIVRSQAGRDKGQLMVVVGIIDENFVCLANGKQRKVDHPKKKKVKHLAKTNHISEECRNQIFNRMVTDAEIRKILKSFEKPDDLGDENHEEV